MINPIQSIGFDTPKLKILNKKQFAAINSFDFFVKYNEVRVRQYFMEKQVLISEKQLRYIRTDIRKKKTDYVKALFLKEDKGQPAHSMEMTLHFAIQKNK